MARPWAKPSASGMGGTPAPAASGTLPTGSAGNSLLATKPGSSLRQNQSDAMLHVSLAHSAPRLTLPKMPCGISHNHLPAHANLTVSKPHSPMYADVMVTAGAACKLSPVEGMPVNTAHANPALISKHIGVLETTMCVSLVARQQIKARTLNTGASGTQQCDRPQRAQKGVSIQSHSATESGKGVLQGCLPHSKNQSIQNSTTLVTRW